jgi:hypothetical protein
MIDAIRRAVLQLVWGSRARFTIENIGAIMTNYNNNELQKDSRRLDEEIPRQHICTDH